MEILGLLKKNRLEKLVSPVKRSPYLHASAKQNFAWRCFFDVNEIPIIISLEIDAKQGRVYLKRLNYKIFIKSFIKAS